MVEIIKGTYGHRQGNTVKPVVAGETVELTEAQEARLVKIGVAKYVSRTVETNSDDSESGDMSTTNLPEYNENMKLVELQEIAMLYGVDASMVKSKKEVVALIDAAQSEPPNLSVDDTVVDDE